MAKKAKKYPTTHGCYVTPTKFEVRLAGKGVCTPIHIQHWKGAMVLGVGKKFESYKASWLRGDELDELIDILREAKKVWLKDYRKTVKHMKKTGMLPAGWGK